MRALEKRTYRYKNPSMTFFCPLCGTERAFIGQPRLTVRNFIQIAIITSVLILMTFSFMGPMVFIWFFMVWGMFELVVRVQFKKEIPCPHCGFDATWYKRDVRVAKRKVQEFWAKKNVSAKSVEELTDALDGPMSLTDATPIPEQESASF